MRRCLVTGAIVLCLASGCFWPGSWSKDVHRRAYHVDAALVVGGLLLAALPCHTGPDDDLDCQLVREMIAAPPIAYGLIGALLNYAVGDGGPDADEPIAPAPPPIGALPPGETPSAIEVPPHDTLHDTAVRAALAARVGDCVGARAGMRTIFRADAAYYPQVVASEPAIATCLR